MFSILALAEERLLIDPEVESLASEFKKQGLAAMDASHLALASSAGADWFCTCDDRLFRKARTLPGLACRVMTLLTLVSEVTK